MIIYPNPANDYNFHRLGSNPKEMNLTIYDMYGKMIINTRVQNDSRIPINRLIRGIYLTQLKDKDRVYIPSD